MKKSEVDVLFKLIKKVSPDGKVVEVGSYLGEQSTKAFGKGIKHYQKPGIKLYCVDTFDEEPIKQFWLKTDRTIYDGFVKKLKGRKMIDAFEHNMKKYPHVVINKPSVVAAQDFEDDSVDLVFIDADHSYESVKEDILAWLPKLKSGGIMCGHDYGRPEIWGVKCGVAEAVNEIFKTCKVPAVSIWIAKKE